MIKNIVINESTVEGMVSKLVVNVPNLTRRAKSYSQQSLKMGETIDAYPSLRRESVK